MKSIKRRFRRAFTIVELVIVIAVVAALAAILIPTFVNVVNAANESADLQTVKNMNTAITATALTADDDLTFCEARDAVTEAGLNSHYSAAYSGNTIYWCQSGQCVVIVQNGSITYPEVDAVYSAGDDDFVRLDTAEDHAELIATNCSCVLCGEVATLDVMVSSNIIEVSDSGGEVTLTYVSKRVTNLIIPEGVTSIGNNGSRVVEETAYYQGNSVLESVVISSTVTEIEEFAFYECTALESVTIGESVTTIGEKAFQMCNSLTSIKFSDNVTEIGEYAFGGCTSLTTVTIPDSVTTIGSSAFADCAALATVVIGNGVTTINSSAFLNCSNIINLTLGESVSSIGSSAFHGCYKLLEIKNLSSLTLTAGSDGYGKVAEYAKNIYTANSGSSKYVTDGDYTFYNDSNTYYLVAYNGTETSITLPDNINSNSYSIYQYAFAFDSSLISVTIGDGVTAIGNYAFSTCDNLTTVTIGKDVASIGTYAFSNCGALSSVTFTDSTSWTVNGGSVSVTNATTNATNLKSYSYYSYEWTKQS